MICLPEGYLISSHFQPVQAPVHLDGFIKENSGSWMEKIEKNIEILKKNGILPTKYERYNFFQHHFKN